MNSISDRLELRHKAWLPVLLVTCSQSRAAIFKSVFIACVAVGLSLTSLSSFGFAQKKGKGSPFNSFPKTSGSASTAKHGHVGAQGNKHHSSIPKNGSRGPQKRPSHSRNNHSSHNHSNHNHYGHSNYSRPVYPRSFGNVYGNRYGGYNPYGSRFGNGIGFSTSVYSRGYASPGFISPGYSTFRSGVTSYGIPYGYGGSTSNYYQPNFSQPFGVSPSDYQHGYQLPNQQLYSNNYSNSELELLRLRLELQRLKQLEAAERDAQRNRVQFQPELDQQDLVPQENPFQEPDPANQAAIDELNLAPIIDAGPAANTTQHRAEKAFRAGRYGQAAQFADLAVSLDADSELLKLFASQAHFANGNYADAANALESAGKTLDSQQWSYVVDNFRLFYGKNDYVTQTRALSDHLVNDPNDANALLMRGFQFGALGYPDAANKDLDRALSIDPSREFVNRLKERFGNIEIEKPIQ